MFVTIPLADGTRLAATLYLPEGLPAPCLLEALPYRKDDVTYGYRTEYEALAGEHGYAVCRVDVRGTGSSEGVPADEYQASEVDDLCQVIAWLAAQDWCDGNVGMYGTSYSGFNALCVAAARPPALKAICSVYASDDRYTDDVHYSGGLHRWLDIVDYPAYMAAMNALPPVPDVYGDGWREEWRRRLEATEPWLPRWMGEQRDGVYWRQGSLRQGSYRQGHDRIAVPTMLVAGWADGYANVVPRLSASLERDGVPYRVIAGPWSHSSPEHALPGPGIELLPEMVRWWDRWLRGDTDAVPDRSTVVFVRSSTAPAPDRPVVNGEFRELPGWPKLAEESWSLDRGQVTSAGHRFHAPGEASTGRADDLRSTWVDLPTDPDIGVAVWNNCAGALPWGQPLDQRFDDARCVTVEWESPAEGLTIVGHPSLRARVGADAGGVLAVRLCDVAPERDPGDPGDVVWTIEQDVLRRVTRCRSGYGSAADLPGGGTYSDRYEGEVTLDRRTRHQTATADSRFAIAWPAGPSVSAESRVEVVADGGDIVVTVHVTAAEDGAEVMSRRWSSRIRLNG